MEYEKVTETIIGCAYRVYNKMGFGFLESVYEIGERKVEIKSCQVKSRSLGFPPKRDEIR